MSLALPKSQLDPRSPRVPPAQPVGCPSVAEVGFVWWPECETRAWWHAASCCGGPSGTGVTALLQPMALCMQVMPPRWGGIPQVGLSLLSLLYSAFCSDRCPSSRRRGLVMVADKTEVLYQQGYWASYNVP